MLLEGEIIGGAVTCGILCRREGSGLCGGSYRLLGREGSCGSLRSSSDGSTWSSGNRSSATYNVESTDIVEPTAIELVGINVELNGQVLTHLNIELPDTVFAKYAEHTLPGELARHLDDIVLRHPWVTCALRYATACRQYGNDSSC